MLWIASILLMAIMLLGITIFFIRQLIYKLEQYLNKKKQWIAHLLNSFLSAASIIIPLYYSHYLKIFFISLPNWIEKSFSIISNIVAIVLVIYVSYEQKKSLKTIKHMKIHDKERDFSQLEKDARYRLIEIHNKVYRKAMMNKLHLQHRKILHMRNNGNVTHR